MIAEVLLLNEHVLYFVFVLSTIIYSRFIEILMKITKSWIRVKKGKHVHCNKRYIGIPRVQKCSSLSMWRRSPSNCSNRIEKGINITAENFIISKDTSKESSKQMLAKEYIFMPYHWFKILNYVVWRCEIMFFFFKKFVICFGESNSFLSLSNSILDMIQ